MEAITNKKVNVQLDYTTGRLCLTGLLVNTMVYLYDGQGGLVVKLIFVPPSLYLNLPCRGVYVLVLSHPACSPEVKRILYGG